MVYDGVWGGGGGVGKVPVTTELREVREVPYVLIGGAGEQVILVLNCVGVAECAGALGSN